MDATVVQCGSSMRIHVHTGIYIYTHIHIYIYMSLLVCMHVCRYACNFMYVCMQ